MFVSPLMQCRKLKRMRAAHKGRIVSWSGLATGLAALTVAACSAPLDLQASVSEGADDRTPQAVDDGSYLASIDPLGGPWRIMRIGTDDLSAHDAWVNFSAGGLLSHGAGCAGGHPAFYSIQGNRITTTRIEPVRRRQCKGNDNRRGFEVAASELELAALIDDLADWARPNARTLVLTTRGGTQAVLSRPVEPSPELAGRWVIETIGDEPFATETRPPILTIGGSHISAFADCNSFGAAFTAMAGDRVSIDGPVVGTQMGCAPADMAEDDLMARAIGEASEIRVTDGRLIIIGGPGLSARRPDAPDRRFSGRYEACGDTLLGAYHDGPITLAIDETSLVDQTGCRATYQAQGPNLTLELDGSSCTGKPTPYVPGQPVSIGGETSWLATVPPDGFGFDNQGRLILRTHRGLLGLCRVGSPPLFGQ